MNIVSWNVNSIRARLPRAIPWLEENRPDVVCLQETKATDDVFPREPFEDLGYNLITFGQKSYNGVAILSREPIENEIRGFPDDDEDFLTFFSWPMHAVTGQPLNWHSLPVVDQYWNASRADKGGFVQEATGWKPGILQPHVYLPTLIDACGQRGGRDFC